MQHPKESGIEKLCRSAGVLYQKVFDIENQYRSAGILYSKRVDIENPYKSAGTLHGKESEIENQRHTVEILFPPAHFRERRCLYDHGLQHWQLPLGIGDPALDLLESRAPSHCHGYPVLN